jgi:7-keto-8-aminopelargonate synthetase-like enzyme
MIDGFRLSGATTRFVQHNSVDDFRLQLTTHRHPGQTVWIATESVFSMDGDLAPLAPLADLCDENECRLIVDEAHATGVYGSRGNGLVDELGLAERVPVRIGTLSKAIGSHGGFAVGSQPLIDWLVNSARSYMYSTALPPLVHIASRHRITQIETMDVERTRLRRTAAHFRQQLVKHGFTTMPGDSPIIPVIIGSDEAVVRISTQLRGAGFYVPAIRPPTVPKDAAMLRISLNLAHTDDQRNALLTALTLTA